MSRGPSNEKTRNRWRLWAFAVFSLLSWIDPALGQTTVNLQQYDLAFSKGIFKFNQGKYDEAQLLFTQALDAKPGDPEAGYYLGQSLIRSRNYSGAEQTFRRFVEADPSFARARLGLAMAQYYQGKHQEALANLVAAQAQLPNDPLVYYFQGLAHIRLGAYEQAEAPLTKAMQLSPDLAPEGHYHRGIALYGQGRAEEAKSEFEAAIAAEPSSSVAQSSRQYLALIRDGAAAGERRGLDPTQPRPALPPAELKRWDLLLTISPQYDTNVVLLPLGVQPPGGTTGISRKDDYRTVFTLRGEYRPLQTETWTVGTAYGFYQSFHRELDAFDVQNHTPALYIQHRYGRLQSRVDYLFDYVTVGREPFLVSNAVRPVFTVREGTSWFTQVQLGYQYKDFKEDRFALNSTRDGINWLFGVTQFFHFAENAGVARIGYIFDTDRTGGEGQPIARVASHADWSYKGHRLSSGVRLPPIWTLTPDLTFDYYRQNYDNPNSFSPDGRTVRQDDIFIVTAGVSRALTTNLIVGLQYSYTRDKSNVPVFDYERNVFSLTLTGSF
ncbi:tetratricopeptide repeat protein [Candidatus Nitrospira bockiana]